MKIQTMATIATMAACSLLCSAAVAAGQTYKAPKYHVPKYHTTTYHAPKYRVPTYHAPRTRTYTPRTAPVAVRGYINSSGTYVAPHYRTAPDQTTSNNWTTKPNVNPFTGKTGTRDPLQGWND